MEIKGSVYIILQRIWSKFPKPAVFLELRDAVEANIIFLDPADQDAIEENDIKASTRIVLQTISRLEGINWISINRENSRIQSICLLPAGRVAFEHYLQREAWEKRQEPPCKTEGCIRKAYRSGYCATCYKTHWKNGTLERRYFTSKHAVRTGRQ